MRGLAALLIALVVASVNAAPGPFIAPAQMSGSIDVVLAPTEVVTPGTERLVTFGMPFPRGSITAAGLSTVRVLRNGVEIPAHVTEMTPWRHRSNASIDGQSVRVARIQIRYTFAAAFPAQETIQVAWGTTPRAMNVPALTNPRTAWHQVTTGTFVMADGVFEPDVYALLPRAWLSQGLIRSSRSTPFDGTNGEARDSAAANDAIAHWPAHQEAERAFKNNFYTMINRDDPSVTATGVLVPYKTSQEPWLYDRGATMFVLYLRSGYFIALREAVRATEFYANRTDGQGFFNLAPGDVKYAYNECLAYSRWLTGDDTLLTKIGNTTLGSNTFPHVWSTGSNFWTERHAAFKLLSNVVAYEVLGGTTRRDLVNTILTNFRTHQDGAGGQIPAQRVDGGLYHFGFQHDGDFADNSLGASSWMTVLLSDAVVRAYATGEDTQTAQFMARLGNFLRATVITADNDYAGPMPLPRYTMLLDGSDGMTDTSDAEHSLDVAGALAWADYFARLNSTPNPLLASTSDGLYATYDEGVNFWIRPTAPPANTQYRSIPPRKWGWEHRTSDGIEFALNSVFDPPLFANGFE
jgi:hypothetical protein